MLIAILTKKCVYIEYWLTLNYRMTQQVNGKYINLNDPVTCMIAHFL